MDSSATRCSFHLSCSGCSLWAVPDQRAIKEARFLAALREKGLSEPASISWADLPDRGLRDRLDFQIQEGRLGLFHQADSRTIVDLPICLQLSPALQSWLTDFRALSIPLRRGSVRLRISPSGERGVWLDLANEDVKELFEEKTFLRTLSEFAWVEIGQRRKKFVFHDDRPKLLKDPVHHVWTETWIGDESLPLLSRLGDFSQVGHTANRAILDSLARLFPTSKRTLEFGAGTGNLSFAAAEKSDKLIATEFDSSSAEAFRLNLETFVTRRPEKQNAIQLQVGDFRRRSLPPAGVDTLLVNPPRSGTGEFLRELADSAETTNLIYMSCFPESMLEDLSRFAKDWICEELILIDQFPQTEHVEIMGRWRRP